MLHAHPEIVILRKFGCFVLAMHLREYSVHLWLEIAQDSSVMKQNFKTFQEKCKIDINSDAFYSFFPLSICTVFSLARGWS